MASSIKRSYQIKIYPFSF